MRSSYINKEPEPDNILNTRPPLTPLENWSELKCGNIFIYEGGKVIFDRLPEDLLKSTKQAILRAPTHKNLRLAHKKGQPRVRTDDVTFGFKPSRPVFGHTAGPTRYTIEHSKDYSILSKLAEWLEDLALKHIGDEFQKQTERAKLNILQEYRIGSTGFTQGVINRSNSLYWHYDRGNYESSYSVMVWFIQDEIVGGQLFIPSLKVYVNPIDGGIFIFKGQNLIHGVAPILKKTSRSERMSVVFYTIAAMEKMGNMENELQKSKEREFRKHWK